MVHQTLHGYRCVLLGLSDGLSGLDEFYLDILCAASLKFDWINRRYNGDLSENIQAKVPSPAFVSVDIHNHRTDSWLTISILLVAICSWSYNGDTYLQDTPDVRFLALCSWSGINHLSICDFTG